MNYIYGVCADNTLVLETDSLEAAVQYCEVDSESATRFDLVALEDGEVIDTMVNGEWDNGEWDD